MCGHKCVVIIPERYIVPSLFADIYFLSFEKRHILYYGGYSLPRKPILFSSDISKIYTLFVVEF